MNYRRQATKLEIVCKALVFAQRNHHNQAIYRQQPGHHGGLWFRCSSYSCTEAYRVLYTAGWYNDTHLEKRNEAIQKWKEKILGQRDSNS